MSNGVTYEVKRDQLEVGFVQVMFVKCPFRRRLNNLIDARLQVKLTVERGVRPVTRRFHVADELKTLTRWK